MKYMCVKWLHAFNTEPVLIYSELDDKHWEHRKVEIYADGRRDYASSFESKGDAALSIEPLPLLEEIVLDPQFEVVEINREMFEKIWTEAHR